MRFASRLIGALIAATGMLSLGAVQSAGVASAATGCVALSDAPYVAGINQCSDTVTFSGRATVSPNVPLIGGPGGTFTFTSSSCTAWSDPSLDTSTTNEKSTCTITASGNYTNTICGTGTATITSITTTGAEGAAIDDVGDQPAISFVGGQGTFTAGALTTDDPNAADGKPADELIDVNSSSVNLSVLPGDLALPGACVNGFEVQATVNLVEPTPEP